MARWPAYLQSPLATDVDWTRAFERDGASGTKAATEAVAGALPGMIDAATPELPSATGPGIPMMP